MATTQAWVGSWRSPSPFFFGGVVWGEEAIRLLREENKFFFWKVKDVYKKVSNHEHEFRSSVMHGGVKNPTPPPPPKSRYLILTDSQSPLDGKNKKK